MRLELFKFLLGLVFIVTAFLLIPQTTFAHGQDENTFRHAYKPYVNPDNSMKARVDNFSANPETRLVCVEAFNNLTGKQTHLGCLWISLAPFNSKDMWAMDFNAPTYMLGIGSYKVVYNYQGTDNVWYHIKSVDLMQNWDGMFVK